MQNSDRIKTIFGSEYRLAVLYAIATAEPHDLYPTRITEISGAPANRVGADMQRMAKSGLLTRVRKTKGNQLARYERVESVFWEFAKRVADDWGVKLKE